MNYGIALLISLFSTAECFAATFEINEAVMRSTFRLEGPTGKPSEVTYGTGFLMAIPIPSQPGKGQAVLVTAAHVLAKISGENARIYLREESARRKFTRMPHQVRIRDGNTALWVQHPSADVAVIKMPVPLFMSKGAYAGLLSTDLLADDATLEKFEIHPGDELLCLGYPLGAEANPQGFPILRSGKIASFPLTPAADVRTFLYDFEVFGGNSGGPVYFVDKDRTYGGVTHLGETVYSLVGLVTEEKYQPLRSLKLLEDGPDRTRYEITETRERLRLAVVVPAQFIKETLDILAKREK
jgi:hypothetical protein